MKTRREIAPTIDAQTFRDSVQFLEASGRITPERPGPGRPLLFSEVDAATLGQFLNLVAGGRTRAAALEVMGGPQSAPVSPSQPPVEHPQSAQVIPPATPQEAAGTVREQGIGGGLPPEELVALRAALEAAKAEAEEGRAAEERARREAEARVLAVELARLEAERRALDAARDAEAAKREAREAATAAAIASQSASAAVAKLQGARRRAEGMSFAARLRAAWAFIFKREGGAMLLLPERSSADQERKAA